MSHWGPGAIPPGYTIAPDGSLVPLQPPGPGYVAPYPTAYPPQYPAQYPPQYPPQYAQPPMVQPPMVQPPMLQPAPAVQVSVMVMPPTMTPGMVPMAPMAPVAQPMLPTGMAPSMAAAIAAPMAAPQLGAMAPPAAYAPGWNSYGEQEFSSPNAQLAASVSPQSYTGTSEIVLANDPSRESVNPARPPTGAEARYYGAMSLATSGVILATALATVSLFVVPVGAVLASAAVASGITGSMGFWLLRQGKRSKREVNLHPDIQVKIMNFAARKDGRVTVTSLAQGLGWTLDEAEQALKEMSTSHYVDVELDSDHGVVIYVFRELVKKAPPSLPAKTTGPLSKTE